MFYPKTIRREDCKFTVEVGSNIRIFLIIRLTESYKEFPVVRCKSYILSIYFSYVY